MQRFLVQLHWQNPADLKTEFVAQGEFATCGEVEAWARGVIERRRGECPAGWGPLVCTEDSPVFVKAAEGGEG